MENTKKGSIRECISVLKTVKSVFINLKEEVSGPVVDSEEFQAQTVLESNSNDFVHVDKDYPSFDGILGGKWV